MSNATTVLALLLALVMPLGRAQEQDAALCLAEELAPVGTARLQEMVTRNGLSIDYFAISRQLQSPAMGLPVGMNIPRQPTAQALHAFPPLPPQAPLPPSWIYLNGLNPRVLEAFPAVAPLVQP